MEVDPHSVTDGKSAGGAYVGKKKGRVIAKYAHFFVVDCGRYKRSFRYAECLETKTDFRILSKASL